MEEESEREKQWMSTRTIIVKKKYIEANAVVLLIIGIPGGRGR